MNKETLADLVVRDLYRPKSHLKDMMKRPVVEMRQAIIAARKFVLDDAMSSFLSDLSVTPFDANKHRLAELADSMRHGARIPYPRTWIEWNGQTFRSRMIELGHDKDIVGDDMGNPDDVPPRWGFLLEEHPQIPTAIMVWEFAEATDDSPFSVFATPWVWVYQTVDEPLPWKADIQNGMFGHGVTNHYSEQVGIIFDEPIKEKFKVTVRNKRTQNIRAEFITHKLVIEMAGVLRYLWAFLSTMNDVPTILSTVRPDKGYVARGAYRKFLEHTTIRLNVPMTVDKIRLAKKLVAAVRRRAHQVRGHWRVLVHGDALCEIGMHDWKVDDAKHNHCLSCAAKRVWIDEHQRGDASLGFVTHQYSIGHKVTA